MGASPIAAAGIAGPAIDFKWRGRTCYIKPMDWESVWMKLEMWMVLRDAEMHNRNWKSLVDVGLLSLDAAAAKSEAFVQSAINEGRYSYGSKIMSKIMDPMAGKNNDDDKLALTADQNADPSTFNARMKLFSLMIQDEHGRAVEVDDVLNMMNECGEELSRKLQLAFTVAQPDAKKSVPPVAA